MSHLKNDQQILPEILDLIKKHGLNYLDSLSQRPTSSQNVIALNDTLSNEGIGAVAAFEQFNQRFEDVMVASSGPRFWGFVTGGTTPAAIAGDWLAAIYDQNTQGIKGHGDVSAQIELETLYLLRSLLNLPNDFSGGFVTGATLSNFSCLAIARQWIGHQQGKDFAREGLSGVIPVLSATPHSSSVKSLAMLGIGSNNVIQVAVKDGNREAIDTTELEAKIKSLAGQPFILISSAGTVNTVDYDDFIAIQALRKKYTFWWHIDAAFGGFAACSPRYKHLVEGWEQADSITVDCHKWLNVPYESAVFFVKEKHQSLQVETFQNSNAPYLGNLADNFSFLNLLPENSRRLKALPAWFSLNAYGKEGYCELVERNVALAQELSDFILNDPNFELLAPTRLNNVCFSLVKVEQVTDFLLKLNDTGKVFMTPSFYNGKKGIRASFVNWRTTSDDVQLVITEMKKLLA
ncbi:pyridoxal phosphate-dependent decarboxylase family protein [Pedobacter sp. MW01-1-1]|uniref:pyridoxal phosphate-dependent decarboxylase family protein n=1 Tax=Pedobacter sp. MW01-1-1 TaxID=3383027 RepID=UPI003FF07DF0